METSITPDKNSDQFREEIKFWDKYGLSISEYNKKVRWLDQCRSRAVGRPNGYIKKIVWDEAGGYPEHAWGFVQYSCRPFIQGDGCDGTTDSNIHLIAALLCKRLELDYAELWHKAYPEDSTLKEAKEWVARLLSDDDLMKETLVPDEISTHTLTLLLSDLYQINNRSLVEVLKKKFSRKFPGVRGWWKFENAAKRQQRDDTRSRMAAMV